MKSSDIVYLTIGKITSTKKKLPLIIFAVAILSNVFSVLSNLIYAVFGYVSFFGAINNFLNVLQTVALLVLAVYLILFFIKRKNPAHLAAGIFLLLSNLGFATGMWSICWLVFAVCLALPALRSEDEDTRSLAKMALLSVVVVVALTILTTILWRLPQFLNGLYRAILAAVSAVQMLLMLVLVLHEADAVGDVKGVVDGFVTKVKGQTASEAGGQIQPEAEISADQKMPDFTEPVSAEPASAAAAAAAAAAKTVCAGVGATASRVTGGSGRYQYKTVAGPVGLTISKNTNYADGVKQYAAIIDRESVGGWTLDSIQEIPVTKRAGCLAGLFGRADVTVYFNMLIFRKED